jgi:hypothetical protein
MKLLARIALLTAFALGACAPSSSTPTVVVAGRAQPKDLENSRAQTAKAKREIAELLGHEVAFKLDGTVLERDDSIEEYTERIVRS